MNLLTPKEKEILDLLSKGMLYKEISAALNITINTTKKHASNIYTKLGVCNRTEALMLLNKE